MTVPLAPAVLPAGGLLIACSSHEERCEAFFRRKGDWQPDSVVVFRYDDPNPRREARHDTLVKAFSSQSCKPLSLPFAEGDAAGSLQSNIQALDATLEQNGSRPIVIDISVLTKRHLLMLLRWLDDRGCWDRLWIAYSEPAYYVVSDHIPLSFGLARIHQIPGLPATPDMSRPIRLVVFLGYEGDRALAVYEHVQPMETTLVVPDPPFREMWRGRTEAFNRDLMKLVGKDRVVKMSAIDPAGVAEGLRSHLGGEAQRSPHCNVVCPLGTKPQAVGIYMYARTCSDPPAIIYASPLRHNHGFYSSGIGKSWLLRVPG